MSSWHERFIGLDRAGSASVATTSDRSAAAGDGGDGGDGRGRWLSRFRDSLSRSRRAMTAQIAVGAFDPSDQETWERIEEGLIAADVGVTSTVAIVERLEAEAAAGSLVTAKDLAAALRRITAELMRTDRSLSEV
ncbi:MAG: signal recognition particle receptor subunit alpha, partial [Gaiellales bacterium]